MMLWCFGFPHAKHCSWSTFICRVYASVWTEMTERSFSNSPSLTGVLCLSDPGSRAVCHPPHPCLPVEESSVSAQHPLPPPLPPDCWGAQIPDGHWSWSGSPDPPPWLQVPAAYTTQYITFYSTVVYFSWWWFRCLKWNNFFYSVRMQHKSSGK